MRTENERFFRAAKADAQNSVDNLIMTRLFQIVSRQQVITHTGTQQREDGSTMRYAKALPRDFRFLPGLHGARRTGASQPIQQQHGTRDEGNTTHTLRARRVVFQVSSFPLAGCVDLVHQQLSPRRRLPSSSATRQKLRLGNIAAALIVHTITTTASQRLVVMPEACRGG